jgi:hypothetical protein
MFGGLKMYSALDECECTIDYLEDSITGVATKMVYQGNGIYLCPACNSKVDCSEDVFKIKVQFAMDEGEIVATIISGEERIDHHWNDDEKYMLIRKSLQDSLYEDVDDKWLKSHEQGIFDIEIYFKESSWYGECGTEYDVEVFIVSEVKS